MFPILLQSAQGAIREVATISTSLGDMEFELFSDVSPRAVANFKYLADTRFYDGTAFHRLIAGFMIQGGDPLTRGTTADAYSQNSAYAGSGGPEYTIPNEPTTRPDRAHVRGVLSMAKTDAPDSGGSQFFIMFGSAPWLDNVHAPMGQIISGESVLSAIEPRSKGDKDLPVAPIVIRSIRIRAEFSPIGSSQKLSYEPGTYSGLLRRPDRNQNSFENLLVLWNKGEWNGALYRGPLLSYDVNMDARGVYQITVTRSGAFSARIQYYGRISTFTGSLIQKSLAIPEADSVLKLDPGSSASMRVSVHARKTSGGPVTLVLKIAQVGPSDLDMEDDSAAIAAGDFGIRSDLSNRYVAELAAPFSSFVKTDVSPIDSTLAGSGFLTINIRNPGGTALVVGKLPDNSNFTFARTVSNEGGRSTLQIYFHELQPDFESKRAEFSTYKLSDWYWGGKYFDFPYFKNRFVGVLELPPNPNGAAPKNESGNWLIWIRPGRQSGPSIKQIGAYVVPQILPWTPPSGGGTLSPFVSGAKGQCSVGVVSVGKFQVARSNAAGIFDPVATAPQLRFNPLDGSFQGSYFDNTSGVRIRRTFQGVLLQKEGVNKGVGFSLTESASVPVSLTP